MRHAVKVILVACSLTAVAAPASADPVKWLENGHWYEAVEPSGGLNWELADQAARARMWEGIPGHLATITSPEEQAFIAALLGTANYWLGGYQDPTSSLPADDWHWQTSEPWTYTYWQPGEPNDYMGSESCLQILDVTLGTWNDIACTENCGYLVEYDGIVSVEPTTWGSIKALFGASSR